MIDPNKISTCFSGINGWSNIEDPCIEKELDLQSDLFISESGVKYNDAHPLVSFENLQAIAPNFLAIIEKYEDWMVGSTYSIGNRVKLNGNLYQSLTDSNTGNSPNTSTSNWVIVSLFSNWLKEKQSASTLKIINTVINKKKINQETKSILDNLKIFNGAGFIKDTIIKRGRAVGFEIVVNRVDFLNVIINQIGLQTNDLQSDFPIYLYHSSQEEPIATYNWKSTKKNSFEWQEATPDFIMSYKTDSYDSGGAFYLVYYEDDLNGQAIRKYQDYSKDKLCYTCDKTNYKTYQAWSLYYKITPISISSSDLDLVNRTLWDIRKIGYDESTNWGLNLAMSTKCDVSDLFCRQRNIFADAINKQFASDMLKEMFYSTRDNDLKEEIKSSAYVALNGEDKPKVDGVEAQLVQAIDRLNIDFSDMRTPCLPCSNKNGVNYGAV